MRIARWDPFKGSLTRWDHLAKSEAAKPKTVEVKDA
jgi:hypothetical protein